MYVIGCGRLGRPVLVDLLEFAVDGCLALQVLTVQPFDQLMGRLLALVVGMVAIAEQELAVRGGMLPDPPAARLVTVVLFDQLVDGRADRAPRMPNSSRSEPNPDQNP